MKSKFPVQYLHFIRVWYSTHYLHIPKLRYDPFDPFAPSLMLQRTLYLSKYQSHTNTSHNDDSSDPTNRRRRSYDDVVVRCEYRSSAARERRRRRDQTGGQCPVARFSSSTAGWRGAGDDRWRNRCYSDGGAAGCVTLSCFEESVSSGIKSHA